MFVLAESRAHPMHVGSLLLFEPPMDAGLDFAVHPGPTYRILLTRVSFRR
jgi:hypothetical protein